MKLELRKQYLWEDNRSSKTVDHISMLLRWQINHGIISSSQTNFDLWQKRNLLQITSKDIASFEVTMGVRLSLFGLGIGNLKESAKDGIRNSLKIHHFHLNMLKGEAKWVLKLYLSSLKTLQNIFLYLKKFEVHLFAWKYKMPSSTACTELFISRFMNVRDETKFIWWLFEANTLLLRCIWL